MLAQLLCIVIVFWTAWPALRQPRVEGDDFRYLHNIQQLSSGSSENLIEAAIVENRWDHLWFLNEEGRVRFFRPTVVASYGLDWMLWGDHYAFGLTLTNVLVHLGCCLLVAFLFHRWLGRGLPAIMASVLFAGLWAHGECIWYIAGRTDSLAALGFLGALALHVAGDRWPQLRGWAIPCFAFGLLTKELVVAAPFVFLAYDILVERQRPRGKLYAAYAIVAALVLGLKHFAMGGESSDFVYPYLISPLRPGFVAHLWLQARSYSANLMLAQTTAPFADGATVAAMNSIAGIGLACGLLVVSGILLRRDGRFWLLLLLGVATWLPTSFVYLSERYLYLPSVAFVGILGLLAASRPAKWRNALALAVGLYAVFQSAKLYGKHREICGQLGSVREMAAQLDPVRRQIGKGDHLLLVNVPGYFLRAQFMQETIRVLFDDPKLDVQVLTMMPGQNGTPMRPGDSPPTMGAGVVLRREGTSKLIVEGSRRQRVQEYERFPFSWASLEPGREHRTPELEAHILAGDSLGATAIEFTLPEPLDRYQILVWEADPDFTEHPWIRRANARVRLVW
ncbi:MAG: hypothetical protein DRP64_12880 [Verrucomicrobia bacterium]|nr:MAG: hypothetical protein DRP64_12880 [Verrucomicrobiota bacterium]